MEVLGGCCRVLIQVVRGVENAFEDGGCWVAAGYGGLLRAATGCRGYTCEEGDASAHCAGLMILSLQTNK